MVITDDGVFSRLAEQWDHLVDGCASSTPFQAHAWLNSWWRAYGAPGQLRVAAAYAGGDLVAAAALYVSRNLPVRTLSPVGAGMSDFSDVLVADAVGEDRAEVVRRLGSALRDFGGWDVIDLPEVRPGAAAAELAAQWPGPRSSTPASTCLELPVQDINDLLASLSPSTARTRRRDLRRLHEAGVSSRLVAAQDVPFAVAEFHRLHLAQWQGRGINPEHARPQFRAFLTDALPLMVERGQALVAEYYLDRELMAVAINVLDRSLMGGYLSGVSPALRKRVDVGTLMLSNDMKLAQERRTPVVSLLRGQENYKLRWRPVPVLNRRVILGFPGSTLAVAYLAAAEGRARALPWLRQRAPWLKNLLTGLKKAARTGP